MGRGEGGGGSWKPMGSNMWTLLIAGRPTVFVAIPTGFYCIVRNVCGIANLVRRKGEHISH